MSNLRKYRSDTCLNCGHDLDHSDRYCPNCGQRNSNKELSLYQLLSEYFAGVFAYDSKLFSSIRLLISSPGKLSQEFLSGKRVRYVNPFRFFISISILFFILISSLLNIGTNNFSGMVQASDNMSFDLNNKGDEDIPKDVFQELDQNHYLDFDEAKEKYNLDDNFYIELKFIYTRAIYKMKHEPQGFINYIFSKLPFFIFFFIPIFTLISYLFYVRRDFTYIEHLVFNFNLSTVFFIVLTINVLISSFLNINWIKYFMFLYFVYLFIATKRFYGQGYIKTFIKTCLSALFFIVSSVIVIVLMLIVSILFF